MKTQRRAWQVMLAAYFAGVVIALNQFKVPPVMQTLLADLQMDMATGGWLMSSFAVAGVVLGLPAALVFARLGPKRAGLLALGCSLAGSLVGALATNAAGLLLGRVIEGVGLGLITVIAPAIISLWFAPADRGKPMGLWASWVPVGSFAMFNLAGPLRSAFGWQGLWWFGALAALVALVIYAVVVDAPPGEVPAPAAAAGRARGRPLPPASILLNPASWLLALVFACFNYISAGYSTWAPAFLNEALGLTSERANFSISLIMLAVIPSTLVAGWLLDRTRRRYLVLTAAVLASGLVNVWAFRLNSPALVIPYMLLMGLVGGIIPTATFTLAPETMPRPELAGWALGIISVGQNLGMFFGPPIVARAVAGGNWSAGMLPLAAGAALGLGASLLLQVETRRQPKQLQPSERPA